VLDPCCRAKRCHKIASWCSTSTAPRTGTCSGEVEHQVGAAPEVGELAPVSAAAAEIGELAPVSAAAPEVECQASAHRSGGLCWREGRPRGWWVGIALVTADEIGEFAP
jgi:hypothetical protein